MGMKIAIKKYDDKNAVTKIDYFYNNCKGIGDFILELNTELQKQGYNIRLAKVKE